MAFSRATAKPLYTKTHAQSLSWKLALGYRRYQSSVAQTRSLAPSAQFLKNRREAEVVTFNNKDLVLSIRGQSVTV